MYNSDLHLSLIPPIPQHDSTKKRPQWVELRKEREKKRGRGAGYRKREERKRKH
jgi:hypothetical protein